MASLSGTMTTTAAPTLSSYSLHPFDAACLQTSDYWIWSWGVPYDVRTVLGGPSQIPSCLPLSWDPTRTYAGTACPPNYTPGCPETTGAGVVTCCPTARSFTCNERPGTTEHMEWFRCQMAFGNTTGTQVVTIVNMNAQGDGTSSLTVTQKAYLHLHALAVVYQTPAITDAPTSTPTASSSSSSSGGGLSAGAAAGIGVGVALGVALVVAALAFWILRRRRQRAQEKPETATTAPMTDAPPPVTRDTPSEMQGEAEKRAAVEASAHNYTTHPTPGHTVPGRHEMEVDYNQRTELPT